MISTRSFSCFTNANLYFFVLNRKFERLRRCLFLVSLSRFYASLPIDRVVSELRVKRAEKDQFLCSLNVSKKKVNEKGVKGNDLRKRVTKRFSRKGSISKMNLESYEGLENLKIENVDAKHNSLGMKEDSDPLDVSIADDKSCGRSAYYSAKLDSGLEKSEQEFEYVCTEKEKNDEIDKAKTKSKKSKNNVLFCRSDFQVDGAAASQKKALKVGNKESEFLKEEIKKERKKLKEQEKKSKERLYRYYEAAAKEEDFWGEFPQEAEEAVPNNVVGGKVYTVVVNQEEKSFAEKRKSACEPGNLKNEGSKKYVCDLHQFKQSAFIDTECETESQIYKDVAETIDYFAQQNITRRSAATNQVSESFTSSLGAIPDPFYKSPNRTSSEDAVSGNDLPNVNSSNSIHSSRDGRGGIPQTSSSFHCTSSSLLCTANATSAPQKPNSSDHLSNVGSDTHDKCAEEINSLYLDKDNEKEIDKKEFDDELYLTPAQKFYRDNREKLIERAREYYLEKQRILKSMQSESNEVCSNSVLEDENEKNEEIDKYVILEEEYMYHQSPVVRPPKNHSWQVSENYSNIEKKEIELEKYKMPTIEQITQILEQERIFDVKVVDLNSCGRRDIGMYAIVGSGNTDAHCRRVARLLNITIRSLEIPFISNTCYCYSNKKDEWLTVHAGALHIHLFTSDVRDAYNLENLWLFPHEHFRSDDFPAYFDYTQGTPPPYLLRNISSVNTHIYNNIHNDEVNYEYFYDSRDYYKHKNDESFYMFNVEAKNSEINIEEAESASFCESDECYNNDGRENQESEEGKRQRKEENDLTNNQEGKQNIKDLEKKKKNRLR